MGLFASLITQVAVVSLVIGHLKRTGFIRVAAEEIKSEPLRVVIMQAIKMGEEGSMLLEKLLANLQEELRREKRN